MLESEQLGKARNYEKEHISCMKEEERALFHLSAPTGWINDPNGFSKYQGVYHLFYQYHPYSTVWGPMHWGHSISQDFISWELLPAALAPDTDYDGQGCFSGSALEYDGKHVLMYTGVLEKHTGDGERYVRQSQCIAIGDGRDYKKIEQNPVIRADILPEGSSIEDFRDPKIWREDGKFYAVAGSRAEDGSGQIPLFESEDLKEWKFVTILESCRNEYGLMWECPDFFRIDDKHILLISPQDMKAEDLTFHNGNGTAYMMGTYDRSTHRFTRETVSAVDYGLDFYAPQTLETEDKRRIMIGWMQSWDNHICPGGRQWSGMMSIPRELSIREGKLIQNPVRELELYRTNAIERYEEFNPDIEGAKPFTDIKGRTVDMTLEITGKEYRFFTMMAAAGEGFHTDIIWDAKEEILKFDRTYCGLRRDFAASRSMHADGRNGRIKIRIIMDKYSVEIFVNDGEQAMTSLIETPLAADAFIFRCDGKCSVQLCKYDIAMNGAAGNNN